MASLDPLHVEAYGRDGTTASKHQQAFLTALGPLRIGSLDGELASLQRAGQHEDKATWLPDGSITYGEDPQQGGFAGILQADHGDVHLGRPLTRSACTWLGCVAINELDQTMSISSIFLFLFGRGYVLESGTATGVGTYQNKRKSQS